MKYAIPISFSNTLSKRANNEIYGKIGIGMA